MARLKNIGEGELELPLGIMKIQPGQTVTIDDKLLENPGVTSWISEGKAEVEKKKGK